MILFYMDESGVGLKDTRSPFFVLAAVAIDVNQCRLMDDRVSTLKRRLFTWAKPEDWEIKGRNMRQGLEFFKNQSEDTRFRAMREVVRLITDLPCKLFAVQVDKRDLPGDIASDDDLYRIAFWRLLEDLEAYLEDLQLPGMLMMDARSDQHSNSKDRRLLDAFREWVSVREKQAHFIELPWFGFSAFYAGLQLADFVAYSVDWLPRGKTSLGRDSAMEKAVVELGSRLHLVHIP